MNATSFSRIAIIQSLPEGDPQTGRRLRDAIELVARFEHGIDVDLYDAVDASTFWMAFDQIRERMQSADDVPIVHIETHGLDDKSGLSLGDRTAVDWEDLKTKLTDINRQTGCRLLVTLAACHGAYLQATLDMESRAPCWALMGPSGLVTPPDLVSSYAAFFRELIAAKDADSAMNALTIAPEREASYFLFTSEDFFKNVFRLHRQKQGSRAQLDDRVERFRNTLKRMGYPGEPDWLRQMIVQSEMEVLAGFFTRFFFVDEFPENRDRFKSALESMRY